MDRRVILDKIQDQEQRYLAAQVMNKADLAEKQGSVEKTDFMDPARQAFAQRVISQYGRKDVQCCFFGGYEGAERRTAVFYHAGYYPDDTEAETVCIEAELICCLACEIQLPERQKQSAVLSHRDYLGALMGLGIEREKIGDILTADNGLTSHIFLCAELCGYVEGNLFGVGKYTVSLKRFGLSELALSKESDFKDVRLTVSSLRLDCVLAAALHCSRGKALEMVRAGIVSVNWEKCGSGSSEVREGDVLSIRGFGRLLLRSIVGDTKKGRIAIIVGRS